MTKLIYLAAPYTFNGTSQRLTILKRVLEIDAISGYLFQRGFFVYSPISHTHPIKEATDSLDGDWQFWAAYDERMISHCDKLMVFTLHGWEASVGVTAELRIAKKMNKPISYISPLTRQITAAP